MSIHSPLFRICAALIILTCLIAGYWWLTWSLIIIFLFLFPLYYEIIGWGIMYDALYGVPLAQFHDFAWVFTAASTILFLIAFFLRRQLSSYES